MFSFLLDKFPCFTVLQLNFFLSNSLFFIYIYIYIYIICTWECWKKILHPTHTTSRKHRSIWGASSEIWLFFLFSVLLTLKADVQLMVFAWAVHLFSWFLCLPLYPYPILLARKSTRQTGLQQFFFWCLTIPSQNAVIFWFLGICWKALVLTCFAVNLLKRSKSCSGITGGW